MTVTDNNVGNSTIITRNAETSYPALEAFLRGIVTDNQGDNHNSSTRNTDGGEDVFFRAYREAGICRSWWKSFSWASPLPRAALSSGTGTSRRRPAWRVSRRTPMSVRAAAVGVSCTSKGIYLGLHCSWGCQCASYRRRRRGDVTKACTVCGERFEPARWTP